MIDFLATCPKNIEGLLAEELTALGAVTVRQTVSAVHFSGDLTLAYRVCLWSRLANRILLPLATFPMTDAQALYDGVRTIPWEEHIATDGSLLIDFIGASEAINNTHFGAQKVKDGIVDAFREKTGLRPSINHIEPDVRVNTYLYNDTVTVSIDLSGESLHRRGYRLRGGEAPLKENLAAAVLYRMKWPELAAKQTTLLDPMCGSGTLLIEAGLMAADIAPGLLRTYFGFKGWLKHEPATWQTLWQEALVRREQGLQKPLPDIRGYDGQPKSITEARENVARVGLENVITITVRELSKLVPPTHGDITPGLIVTNPPYGERLGHVDVLAYLYQHLGQRLKEEFVGWDVGILTGTPELGKNLRMRCYKQYPFFNGALPVKLLLFHLTPEWFYSEREPRAIQSLQTADVEVCDPATTMLVNRLRKNHKKLATWLKQNEIQCYRLYDADLPEYAFAIDIYQDWVHVQEYAPPASIDPEKAADRISRSMAVLPSVLGVDPRKIILKQRKKQKGKSQYEKQNYKGQQITVTEIQGNVSYLVNLTDYLDTGLFLDHRPLRQQIYQLARGKRFLNLFCYTASVTAAAGKGGARRSVSVDMSATYLQWARRNFSLNGLSETLHQLVQEDCLNWLLRNDEQFDLILLDPPTFSNSKRMEVTLDVQRDHVSLISQAMRHLSPDGVLFFSTHRHNFKMDFGNLSQYSINDVTAKTLDKDFSRTMNFHYCWEIRHG